MRWITPQELAKVARKSENSPTTVPERTLRHMAAQNRFQVKKEGKTWLINPASALSAGLYIPPAVLESWRISRQPTAEVIEKSESQIDRNSVAPKDAAPAKKKYTKLAELGVYTELRSVFVKEQSSFSVRVRESFKQTLYHLALGFFEYQKVSKAECFRRARKCLVGALVEDDLESAEPSSWRDQIESSIMPGIAGLIRKQEGGKHGIRDKAQTFGKSGAVLR